MAYQSLTYQTTKCLQSMFVTVSAPAFIRVLRLQRGAYMRDLRGLTNSLWRSLDELWVNDNRRTLSFCVLCALAHLLKPGVR